MLVDHGRKPMAKNFYEDNADLRFNIENQDWEEIFPLIEPDTSDPESPKNFSEAKVLHHEFLNTLGEYIAEQIAPKAHELDEQHPSLIDKEMVDGKTMSEFIKGLIDMGAMALPFPRHVGGFNFPWLIAKAVGEMIARADVSLMTYYSFFTGIGQAFYVFALDEGKFECKNKKILSTRYDHIMKDAASGKGFGAMCLTEPQAGSDLGQIRTKATLSTNGFWHLEGQKIWITCGHGEHHLVLARSESEKTHPGLKGLSLFYVPAHIEKNGQMERNFEIAGQEKKMGQPSSVTVTINYDNSRAELVGQRGHGFRNMAIVMNDARLLVGFEGIGICEKAYRMAYDFANERMSMGKKISEHEMIAEYLDEMDVENKALRALAYYSAFNEEMANRIKAKIKIEKPKNAQSLKELESKANEYKWKARLSTPMVKYCASENAVRFCRMNMQVMGGVGYMKEYGAEKLMRDSLVMPIYEGTSQIQSLMVLKDHLQHSMRNPAKFFSKMAQSKIQIISGKTLEERTLARLKSVYYSAIQSILTRIVADKFGDLKGLPLTEWKSQFLSSWDAKHDFSFGLLHAERFCQIASRLFMAKVLVKQALKVKDPNLKNERLFLSRRFMERAETKMRGLLHEIESSKSSIFIENLYKNKNLSKKKQDEPV